MALQRFLFRVKDKQIEKEAITMVSSLDIEDVEIRRDETVKEAWLEDYEIGKTVYGLDEIEEYFESLVSA
ncbi:MAG: hypothetical protein ACOC88_03285 [Candidatus Bipolaricaulota bacterium]|nr:hypothetical protein [Candidatus Bipolaricaulota bacterium]